MARVIITGGSGKVGRACIQELLQHSQTILPPGSGAENRRFTSLQRHAARRLRGVSQLRCQLTFAQVAPVDLRRLSARKGRIYNVIGTATVKLVP